MGWELKRSEPIDMELICSNLEMKQIFLQASWMEFFDKYSGYNDVIAINFSH